MGVTQEDGRNLNDIPASEIFDELGACLEQYPGSALEFVYVDSFGTRHVLWIQREVIHGEDEHGTA